VIPRRLNFICRRFGTLCLFHLHRQVMMKMERTECSETSAYKIQTPGNRPKGSIQQFSVVFLQTIYSENREKMFLWTVHTFTDLHNFKVRNFKLVKFKVKTVIPCGMKHSGNKVAEEHCWAITQTVGRSHCRRSGPGLLGFGFRLAPLFKYMYLNTCRLKSDLRRIFWKYLLRKSACLRSVQPVRWLDYVRTTWFWSHVKAESFVFATQPEWLWHLST